MQICVLFIKVHLLPPLHYINNPQFPHVCPCDCQRASCLLSPSLFAGTSGSGSGCCSVFNACNQPRRGDSRSADATPVALSPETTLHVCGAPSLTQRRVRVSAFPTTRQQALFSPAAFPKHRRVDNLACASRQH